MSEIVVLQDAAARASRPDYNRYRTMTVKTIRGVTAANSTPRLKHGRPANDRHTFRS